MQKSPLPVGIQTHYLMIFGSQGKFITAALQSRPLLGVLIKKLISHFQQHIFKNDSCYLRFRSDPSTTTNTYSKPAEIKSFSNETHNLLLTVERENSLRHFDRGHLKLGSKLIPIGQENPENLFIFLPVSFELFREQISGDNISDVYRADNRHKNYCPTVHQQQLEMKENGEFMLNSRSHRHSEPDTSTHSIFSFEELFARCKHRSTLELRSSCRNGIQTKCHETLPAEMSQMCDNLTGKRKPPVDVKKVKNCDTLQQKSDRKRCLRHKRKQCRRKVADRHRDWTHEQVVQKCKNLQKKFKQCVRRKMRNDPNLTKKSAMKICRRRTRKVRE